MNRRSLLFGLLLAVAVLTCFAGWLVIGNAHKPTRARFDNVKDEMSRQAVVRLVGPPDVAASAGDGLFDYWLWDGGQLRDYFDDEAGLGTSSTSVVYDVDVWAYDEHPKCQWKPPRPPTLSQRIRRWLGL